MRPRAAVPQTGFAFRAIAPKPLAHRCAVNLEPGGHRSDWLARNYRLNHPQSPNRRHWGILMAVHSILLAGTDGVGTISVLQLDRGGNVLKAHT